MDALKDQMEEILDECFPKEKSKERGAALVMFAEILLLVRKLIVCEKCYGKGYATVLEWAKETEEWGMKAAVKKQLSPMRFCGCERGKQLKKILCYENPQ